MVDSEETGYYEVQLNNKQLIFFFMAAVAISVVVFLCGLMVGRGVHDARIAAAQPNLGAGMGRIDARQAALASQPSETRLDYQQRLEQNEREVTLRSTSPEVQMQTTSTELTPPIEKAAPSSVAGSESEVLGNSSGTYSIQVVALKTGEVAQELLGRLQRKQYRAYLEEGGNAGLHRVRVGKFHTREEAELVAEKLRIEEKFKPYIIQ